MKLKRLGQHGTVGLSVYAAIFFICLLSSQCQKIYIVGDRTSRTSIPLVQDTLSISVTATDGVIAPDGSMVTPPGATMEILRGEDLLYDVYYSIDGGETMQITGNRRDNVIKLNLSGYEGEGSHHITGLVTNTFEWKNFTLDYRVSVTE